MVHLASHFVQCETVLLHTLHTVHIVLDSIKCVYGRAKFTMMTITLLLQV